MVKKEYIPDRGDLVWIDFNPQKGREQADKRPAIVLSPKTYNVRSSLALMCPITSRTKGYPFEVSLSSLKISGTILADQIRSLDWHARPISFIQKINPEKLRELQEKIVALIVQ